MISSISGPHSPLRVDPHAEPDRHHEEPIPESLLEIQDSVSISRAARELSAHTDGEEPEANAQGDELSEEEKAEVAKLRSRDAEVRAHENAHKAAAGNLASGGPTFEYETGPDGKRYAVGGEVNIRIPQGRTPEESIRIARRAQRAANAPASPSGQDRSVAASAAQMEAQARADLAKERNEKFEHGEEKVGDATPTTSVDRAIEAYTSATASTASQLLQGLIG